MSDYEPQSFHSLIAAANGRQYRVSVTQHEGCWKAVLYSPERHKAKDPWYQVDGKGETPEAAIKAALASDGVPIEPYRRVNPAYLRATKRKEPYVDPLSLI